MARPAALRCRDQQVLAHLPSPMRSAAPQPVAGPPLVRVSRQEHERGIHLSSDIGNRATRSPTWYHIHQS